MKWFGIIALLFMLFVLAGVVYLGANSTKLGLNWGEPSAISKNIPAQTTTQTTSPSTTSEKEQTTKSIDVCSDVDGYCMSKYGMMNPTGFNSCVKSVMYQCHPELKTQQWSKKTCDRLQQELTEIRVKKSLIPASEIQYPEWQSLAQDEFDVSQDILYHCRD